MAEAVQGGSRFYCHVCSMEINSVNSEYKCPVCSNGFIEELPPLPSIPNATTENNHDADNERSDLEHIRDEIATLLVSRTGVVPTVPGVQNISISTGDRPESQTIITGQPFHRLDNILLEVLNTLSRNDFGGMDNGPMFFMGNPGDYAWGREGIDTIVTQLLNQMENSGPPPLSKENIDQISTVLINENDIENKLQCSVCWEDFNLNEGVRKLPCMHCYHNNCIVKWLQLNGTCPICRKSVVPEHENGSHNGDAIATSSGDSSLENAMDLDTVTLSHNEPVLRNVGPTYSSATSTRFDDGNVEYDFD